ncbi:MAG: hypothetical protein K0S14_2960 [Thermomicrobiales bacterium]|nr:hypothetical protein [Thermomicrobiales bacterium]
MIGGLGCCSGAGQLRGLRKGHAEPLVLGLVPTSSDPQLQPATRDVINRDRLLGEQRRVTEGVAAYKDADAWCLGLQRQRCQQRPTFEKRRVGETRPLIVVGMPDRVEPELLEHLPVPDERLPRQILIANDPEPWLLRHLASGG